MAGLARLCKMYGSMEVSDAYGNKLVWIWDYVNDKARLKNEMTKEEIDASEKAKWMSVKDQLDAKKVNNMTKKSKNKTATEVNTVLAAVPYQCCPLCNGNGQTVADGFISSVYQTCKVCNGEMIIPMHIVDELGNNANLLLPADLLDEILAAIANYEEIIDGEWGCGRSVEQLIKDGRMPKLYNKLLAIKNGA